MHTDRSLIVKTYSVGQEWHTSTNDSVLTYAVWGIPGYHSIRVSFIIKHALQGESGTHQQVVQS